MSILKCTLFSRELKLFTKTFRMSTFVSKLNVVTGKMEWELRDDDYDYHQEIARSAYADMLHDTERNQMYYKALEKGISSLRRQNKPVYVLDIGTGTGLLSMMAAKLGADAVYACEAFKPMAECARKIIKENGFQDRITLIPKRSTQLTVGTGGDLPQRANVLVTEVFDTELIGEGAIGTFTHAHQELLEKDCVVVPAYGNMYVQLVTSDVVRRWNQIDDIEVPNSSSRVTAPARISCCGGAPSLHDLQLDQLPESQFTPLTEPFVVFRYDFTGRSPLQFDNTSVCHQEMLCNGQVDGVMMWWDLEMDYEADILLSCAPRWAHPTPNNMQWRDHWMQAIYYPYSRITVTKGDQVNIISKQDEYSLWFDVAKDRCKDMCPEERPVCRCGAHVTLSRSRMGMLSEPRRRALYTNVLQKYVSDDSVCLFISDGSLLPLMAALQGARHVYTLESNFLCQKMIRDFIKHNQLQDKITLLDKAPEHIVESDFQHKVDVVIGEPVFQTSVLPWDNMCFWYQVQYLAPCMSKAIRILPGTMRVYGVPVEYEHLWKIRADVGICEGFSLTEFDRLIKLSSDKVDETIEPQPLWEYPCRASGPVTCLLEVDLARPVSDTSPVEEQLQLTVSKGFPCNGMALWADFVFDESNILTTGPVSSVSDGDRIDWDMYTRQGIHLFYNSKRTDAQTQTESVISVHVKFVPSDGAVTFKFEPQWT